MTPVNIYSNFKLPNFGWNASTELVLLKRMHGRFGKRVGVLPSRTVAPISGFIWNIRSH
ncbi:hypothetical protein Mapa_006532 [Marchantia paleacea]|nr:hypothetical protein Mapa_006532 [Marchantia paleacea]